MNWNQLYTAASPCERQELIRYALQVIEARSKRLIIARGRRVQSAHFVNNRRRPSMPSVYLLSFLFILVTLSIATWLVALRIHPNVGAPLVFLYAGGLFIILSCKPNKRISHAPAS